VHSGHELILPGCPSLLCATTPHLHPLAHPLSPLQSPLHFSFERFLDSWFHSRLHSASSAAMAGAWSFGTGTAVLCRLPHSSEKQNQAPQSLTAPPLSPSPTDSLHVSVPQLPQNFQFRALSRCSLPHRPPASGPSAGVPEGTPWQEQQGRKGGPQRQSLSRLCQK